MMPSQVVVIFPVGVGPVSCGGDAEIGEGKRKRKEKERKEYIDGGSCLM